MYFKKKKKKNTFNNILLNFKIYNFIYLQVIVTQDKISFKYLFNEHNQ